MNRNNNTLRHTAPLNMYSEFWRCMPSVLPCLETLSVFIFLKEYRTTKNAYHVSRHTCHWEENSPARVGCCTKIALRSFAIASFAKIIANDRAARGTFSMIIQKIYFGMLEHILRKYSWTFELSSIRFCDNSEKRLAVTIKQL